MATQRTTHDNASTLPDLAPDADHFTVLGLSRRFDVSESDIDAAYRDMARKTHPDRFSGASTETIVRATQLAAAVNDARRTLRNPVTRADYLLTLAGGPTANEVREVPGNLLAEVMMLREQLESDKAAGNGQALEQHRITLQRQRASTLDKIATLAHNIAGSDDEQKRALRIELNAIKYYDNLLQELAEDPLSSEGD